MVSAGLSAGLIAVVSAVDDGFASLWRDHLAPLVIGIDSPPVQNLMCFRTIGGQCQKCATKSEKKKTVRDNIRVLLVA